MDTATKTGMDIAKAASKRIAQKTAEATEDLIGNKIANKITLAGKAKNKGIKKNMKLMKYKKFIYPQRNLNKLLML